MIPTAGTQRIKRTTTGPFVYVNKAGETVTETIHIEFYARTMPQIREQRRRQLEQARLAEERFAAEKAVAAAKAAADDAREALEEATDEDSLTLQQAYNEAMKTLVDATNALGDKVKETALLEPQWLSVELAGILAGLPDLQDPSGKGAFRITVENLETLSIQNLENIEKAIAEYVDPKSQPSK